MSEHHAVFDESTPVLVPLCGKSVDLEWLVIHGFQVVELSELAVQAFFPPFSVSPEEVGELYAAATEIRRLASHDARAG